MDFELSEEQRSLQELCEKIISDFGGWERVRQHERDGAGVDAGLWEALAGAGLLGIPVPEDAGGLGLGLLETCVLLEVVGRHAVAAPVLESVVTGAWPLATFGHTDAHRDLVRQVVAGTTLLSAALEEAQWSDVHAPATRATPEGEGWRLHGVKEAVPLGPLAQRVLVSATTDPGEVRVFLVDPRAAGAEMAPAVSTTLAPLGQLRLDGAYVAPEDVLGGPGDDVSGWIYRRAVAGLCVLASGVLDGGLRITADYVSHREQFGRPIGTFQGVAMRIADAYIDAQAVRLTAWSAAWRLAQGLAADESLAVAKFWVADGGQRAVHAFQHLHGGVGVDEDYPIHRYFTLAKALEVALGGATPQLLRLGAALAEEGAGGVH